MDYTKMSQYSRSGTAVTDVDQGLRAYMIKVYNFMALALVITGVTAYATANTPALLMAVTSGPIMWLVMLAPVGIAFFLGFKVQTMSYQSVQALFWAFAVLMGLSLSTIFVVYTSESVARVFFITASVFGAMSLYGYTTKKDLSSWGSFLIMGLVGIILASLVNIFLQSSALQFAVSVIGVLIFVGLTAYDTQRIRETYYAVSGHGEMLAKAAVMGALNLYMDFINLFIHLMRFFGERR